MARPSKHPPPSPKGSDRVGATDLALFLSSAVEAGLVAPGDRGKVAAELRGKQLAEVAAYFARLKPTSRNRHSQVVESISLIDNRYQALFSNRSRVDIIGVYDEAEHEGTSVQGSRGED